MTAETPMTGSTDYEVLSCETVRQMHQKFMAGVEEKAKKAVPPDAPNPEAVADSLKALLIAATRKAIEVKSGELAEIARNGVEAIEKRTAEVKKLLHAKSGKAKHPSPALSEEQAREVAAAAASRKENSLVPGVFGDADRIYLRPSRNAATEVSPVRGDIEWYLAEKGYRITDYGKGYATDKDGKQQFRIGKLLKEHPILYRHFTEDMTRTLGNLLFVISRRIDDIAHMATGRAWHSCMGSGGGNWEYVPKAVESGALIAYMISEKDPDILNPLARIQLRPFHKQEGAGIEGGAGQLTCEARAVFGPPEQIFVTGRTYGLKSKDFSAAVKHFIEEKFNRGKEGKFELVAGLYEDDYEKQVVTRAGPDNKPLP